MLYIYGIRAGKNNSILMDFIVGEKFYNVADFVFSSDRNKYDHDDYNKQVSTFDIGKLKDTNIVYLHTIYKDKFFEIIKNLDYKFVVVTHNSDINIDDINNLPDNVIKWFSQNVDIIDDRLQSLPIGLENERWFQNIRKKEKIVSKVYEEKNIKNLLYINHNINTNKLERIEPYKLLDNDWTTLHMGANGQNFDTYLDNIYNHKFVLSPRGNGIDTHRKWEALYLNTIPIEKRNVNNTFYEDLPICFVDNWGDITEEFLNSEYERITNTEWNMDKLNMSYWSKSILKNVK